MRNVLFYVGIVLLGLLTVLAWRNRPPVNVRPLVLESQPTGIMGTSCSLCAVVPFSVSETSRLRVQEGLSRAEEALRQEEARLSNWMDNSEISRWNRSKDKSGLDVSPSLNWILHRSESARQKTEGAFDINCGSLLKLWKQAQEKQAFPTDAEIQAAQADRSDAQLGGVAKGFAIDQAMDALCSSLGRPVIDQFGDALPALPDSPPRTEIPVLGLMIDVGGDILVLGRPAENNNWTAKIVNPFSPNKIWGSFQIDASKSPTGRVAVCTSGEYHRGYKIGNRWFSHIIDPRTGRPLEHANGSPVSVTVIAPSCMEADIWATALSVLGPDGLSLIPEDVQAYWILGSPERPESIEIRQTANFPTVLLSKDQIFVTF